MGFMDKFKETASAVSGKVKETGATLGDKSKIAIEKQKIKSNISKKNSSINDVYKQIGEKYFKLFSEQPSSEFIELVETIKSYQNEIIELNSKLDELDDCVTCSNCGSKVPKGTSFCSHCGNAIINVTVEEPVEPTETIVPDEVISVDVDTDTTDNQ